MRPVIRGARGARRPRAGHRTRLRPDARACASGSGSRTRRSATTAAAAWRPRGSGSPRARSRSPTGPRAGASTSRSATAPTTSRSRPSCSASPARRRSTTSGRPSSTRSTAGSRAGSSCPTRSRRSGWPATAPGPASCAATPASRRSTTWPTSSPIRAVLDELGLDPAAPLAVVRTPPAVSLYHRFEHPLFGAVLRRLREQAQVVVLPRTPEQRAALAAEGGYVVPERAIDAQSLIAYADLVVSAGGTMNREAVALGTPVWTTFEGRLGAVDERLIAEGRLRRLAHAEEITVAKRAGGTADDRVRRDPGVLADLLTGARGEENCPRAGSMPGCAGGSAPRPPSRFIATACPRWPWTLGWSRSPTTSPTSSASTERFPRSTGSVRADDHLRRARQRVRVLAVRAVPALDALLVAARVHAGRPGGDRRHAGAAGLRRRRPAEAHVHRRPLHVGHDPGGRARALRAADALLPRRLALPRAPALRAPAGGLPRARATRAPS